MTVSTESHGWIRQGSRFDVNEIFNIGGTIYFITEQQPDALQNLFFFFFKKNIHKVVELYCFLLLRYNQNNFFVHQAMQMKVEEIAKFF